MFSLLFQVGVFFGGLAIQKDEEFLKTHNPQIVVGTPGRILALIRNKKLNLKLLKHFILDECDKMLEQLEMRRDVQEIFRNSPHTKQVMMFSATLSKEIRPVCKKFMHDVRGLAPLSPYLSSPFSLASSSALHLLGILANTWWSIAEENSWDIHYSTWISAVTSGSMLWRDAMCGIIMAAISTFEKNPKNSSR